MSELISIGFVAALVALCLALALPRASAYFLGPLLLVFALALFIFANKLFFPFQSDGSPAGLIVPGMMWLTLIVACVAGSILMVVGLARIRSGKSRPDETVYTAAGGHDGLLKLAAAWHARVLQDEVVSHAFSHGFHPQHTERLATYWAEALGGPTNYSDQYGNESSVVRIHSGNGPHEDMDQRAIACFDQALEDVGLARDKRMSNALHDYFVWATTTTMARYPHSAKDVPEGLRIPKWSWRGLVHE